MPRPRGRPPDEDDDLGYHPSRKRPAPSGSGPSELAAFIAAEKAKKAAAAAGAASHLLLPRGARPAAARPPSRWARTDPTAAGANKGVDARRAADETEEEGGKAPPGPATLPPRPRSPGAPSAAALARSEAALARKAALYDALVAGQVPAEGAATAGGCVDFGARAQEERERVAAAAADAADAADAFLEGAVAPPPPYLPPPPPPPPPLPTPPPPPPHW